MHKLPRTAMQAALAALLPLSSWAMDEVTVTVRNLTHGVYFTPLIVTAHGEDESLFRVGTEASEALQTMAEGGNIEGLLGEVGGADEDTFDGRDEGLTAPGEAKTARLRVDQEDTPRLSLAAMLLPTNDGFVGLDSIEIPTEPGTYVYYADGYDAGTEANDEIVNGGGANGTPGIPMDPGGNEGSGGTGAAEEDHNTRVHVHRGVLGDTDPDGGISDLDSRVHRWMNPVAEVTIDDDPTQPASTYDQDSVEIVEGPPTRAQMKALIKRREEKVPGSDADDGEAALMRSAFD